MNIKHYTFLSATILFVALESPVLAQAGSSFGQGFVLTTNLRLILSIVAAVLTVLMLWSQIKTNLRPMQYGVIGLVTFTAFVHLISGANEYILFMNGIGYMVLLLALYFVPLGDLARYHPIIYAAMLAYTIVTIVLYFVSHPWGLHAGEPDVLGWVTKVAEIILIGCLVFDFRQHRQMQRGLLKEAG